MLDRTSFSTSSRQADFQKAIQRGCHRRRPTCAPTCAPTPTLSSFWQNINKGPSLYSISVRSLISLHTPPHLPSHTFPDTRRFYIRLLSYVREPSDAHHVAVPAPVLYQRRS